jgi:hypothetical protein
VSGERIDVVVFGNGGHFGPMTLTNDNLVIGGALNSMIQLPSTIGAPIISNVLDTGARSWMHVLMTA